MRAIVFLLFIILVFLVVRFTLNRIIEIREQNRQQALTESEKNASTTSRSMVRCAECGVHLPQSEAYFDGTDTFCSEGHMKIFRQKQRQGSEKPDDSE